MSLVTLTPDIDTWHEAVRTTSQMPPAQLLLRRSVMLLGQRRMVCKQMSFKRLAIMRPNKSIQMWQDYMQPRH